MSEHIAAPDGSADQRRGPADGRGDGLPRSLAVGEWDIFISYSRKDQHFATRLHAALNSYQPPRDLPLPQRRLQAFIDTSDFSGPDYRPAIRRHLGHSSKIIVICSPNAVRSRFVGPEIDDFVALHPVEPEQSAPSEQEPATRGDIIPIIIDGLPINEAAGVSDPQNAFPDALCRALALPIAIDYRGFEPRQHKLGEGRFHDPWFTLLANIYGHERAAIEERERKRRARTLRIRSSIAAAVAAGLLTLSVWALWERSTAIDQRTRAYARQQAAKAQTGLSDVLAPAAPAIRDALASVSLERTEEAIEALQTGVTRLPPLWLGQLPVDKEDGTPKGFKFSAKGEFLLGVTEKLVLLWRTADRAVAVRYPVQGAASIIGFTSDGARAALSVKSDAADSEPGRLLVIDIAAGKVAEKSYMRVLDAAATPRGLRALVADADGKSLRVIDLVSDRVMREIALKDAAKIARLSLRDGGVFLVDTANQAWAYPEGAGEAARYPLPAGATPLDFGVHSGLLALKTAARGANSNGLLIVDITTGKSVIDTGGTSVQGFGFAGADRFVLVSGAQGTDWYSATDGKRVLTIENSRAIDYNPAAMTDVARQIPVIDAAPTENGELLVTALKDGRVTAWYPGSRPRYGTMSAAVPMPDLEPVAQFDHGETLGATATWSTIPALFVSPDGRYVASQSDGMKTNAVGGLTSFKPMVRVWDVRHRTEIARFTPQLGMAVVFSPASDLIATLQGSPDRNQGGNVQLGLWRLSSGNGAAERLSAETADFLPKPDTSGVKVYSVAASADARRVVWLSVDGQLWVRRAESGQVEVVDQLRPIAKRVFADLAGHWEQRLKSLDPGVRKRFPTSQGPIDPFTQLDILLEKTSALGPASHLPDQTVPVLPIAVSGNGCCVLVAIGPLLRLYDLDARRVIAERVIPDMIIQLGSLVGAPQDLVISYDGRAFATSIVTWAAFEAFEAAAIAQSERQERGAREPTAMKGEVRAFTLGEDGVVGALEQKLLQIPPVGAWLPMNWPLAIDAHGRQIAIDRITQEDGKPNGTRHIAVINPADPVTPVMETPAEAWNFNPMQLLAGLSRSTTLHAAFSPDDQQLLTVETRPTCASITQISQSWLPMQVPYCAQQTSAIRIWRVATGARAAEISFDLAPVDETTGRQTLGLALSGERTITQTALESTTLDKPGSRIVVTERIRLDDSRLVDEACARLASDERSIRPEDWGRDFPGEPYRTICKPVP
jgi:hypothetical protein